MSVPIDQQLAALETMSLAQLRSVWAEISDGPIPRVSSMLLRMAVAHALQERAYGGLPRRTSQRLAQLAEGKTRTAQAQPGMRLVREWNGVLHVATVAEDGSVVWNDRTWRSLSEVARAITGTRWSGPAFFGLKRKVAA